MKIITVAHQKGGVGKTTIALNLAQVFKDDFKVGIVDTDPQQSVSMLSPMLEGLTVIPFERLDNLSSLNSYSDTLDLIVIDTPPYLTNNLSQLFSYSDFVLVPTKASYLDALAIVPTLEILKSVMQRKKELRAGIVTTMTNAIADITELSAREEIYKLASSAGISLLNTRVVNRVAYRRSILSGGVFNDNDVKAQTEVSALVDEILNLLQ